MYLTFKVEHEESKHFYAKSHLDNWLWIFAQCSLWKIKDWNVWGVHDLTKCRHWRRIFLYLRWRSAPAVNEQRSYTNISFFSICINISFSWIWTHLVLYLGTGIHLLPCYSWIRTHLRVRSTYCNYFLKLFPYQMSQPLQTWKHVPPQI